MARQPGLVRLFQVLKIREVSLRLYRRDLKQLDADLRNRIAWGVVTTAVTVKLAGATGMLKKVVVWNKSSWFDCTVTDYRIAP